MEAIQLDLSEVIDLTDDQLYRLCLANKEIRIERTGKGELVLMTPTGGGTSIRNVNITVALYYWNKQTKLGKVFDSSGGFRLKSGAMRAADAAWLALERWHQLSEEEQEQFPPLCPDFVIELMSRTDRLKDAQDKMAEWMENGCRLAWLIDRKQEKVYIYRQNGQNSVVESFDETLSGEDVLPGFELELAELR